MSPKSISQKSHAGRQGPSSRLVDSKEPVFWVTFADGDMLPFLLRLCLYSCMFLMHDLYMLLQILPQSAADRCCALRTAGPAVAHHGAVPRVAVLHTEHHRGATGHVGGPRGADPPGAVPRGAVPRAAFFASYLRRARQVFIGKNLTFHINN
jgi:hypothetical protein